MQADVVTMKATLTTHKYDPESVAAAQGSTRPGKRKLDDTWHVSSSSAITHASHLRRAQCVSVCISQQLEGAFKFLTETVAEYQKPVPATPPLARLPLARPTAAAKPTAARMATAAKAAPAVKLEANAVVKLEAKHAADLDASKAEAVKLQMELQAAYAVNTTQSETLNSQWGQMLAGARAEGARDALKDEIDGLRRAVRTHEDDARLNLVRAGQEGPAAQTMAVMQFATTLQATQQLQAMQQQPQNNGEAKDGEAAAAPAARPFDIGSALVAAMAGGGGLPRLGYGGEAGSQAWAAKEQEEKQKKRKREKKAKKKAKKAKKKAFKKKVKQVMEDNPGITKKDAKNRVSVADTDSDLGSGSDSDSDSSSSE